MMDTKIFESNKKTARQFFEYFAKGNLKQIENLWGSDYKLHYPGSPVPLDKVESKQLLKEYVTGFPDLKFTIKDQVAEGDLVVTRILATGTQKGQFQGFPASNKRATFTGIITQRIDKGKIEEEWTEMDELGLMEQIGAVSESLNTQY